MIKRIFTAGALGATLVLAAPWAAHAQMMQLKPGWNYAIAFADSSGPVGAVPPQAQPQAAMPGRNLTVYRVLGASPDQTWYRVRMVVRAPQGGWVTPTGAPEVWINLSYAIWVQEVR